MGRSHLLSYWDEVGVSTDHRTRFVPRRSHFTITYPGELRPEQVLNAVEIEVDLWPVPVKDVVVADVEHVDGRTSISVSSTTFYDPTESHLRELPDDCVTCSETCVMCVAWRRSPEVLTERLPEV